MSPQEKNTKQSIIDVANELFAEKGFSATSVREIATKAQVNLAAINYHFKNKENLYWKVFDYNYYWIRENILEIGLKTQTTEELARQVFQFFVSNENAMMNTFKIFLSGMTPGDEGLLMDQQEEFGPPGHEVFLEKIKEDLGIELSKGSLNWAVKMIFSLLFHYGVVLNTKIMKKKCLTEPDLSHDKIEEFLIESIRAHLFHLKQNPSLF